MRSIVEQIGETLAKERGGEYGFLCIWRKKGDPLDDGSCVRNCSVEDWLGRPENQVGTWLIDGGWGGPPGPIYVRWNEDSEEWENGGFCGRKFA